MRLLPFLSRRKALRGRTCRPDLIRPGRLLAAFVFKCFLIVFLACLASLLSPKGYAQDTVPGPTQPELKENKAPAGVQEDSVNPAGTYPTFRSRTMKEQFLTVVLLVFGLMVLGMATLIIYRQPQEINNLFKYFIIVLVVLGVMVLILIGYDKDQITPAVGLFGTIAGYLLGKSDNTASASRTGNT